MDVKLLPKQRLELETLDKKYNSLTNAYENVMKRHGKHNDSAAYIHARQDWIRCRGEHAEARHEFFSRIEKEYVESLGQDREKLFNEAEKQICFAIENMKNTRADVSALKADEITELVSKDINTLLNAMDKEDRKRVYALITEKTVEAMQAFHAAKVHSKRIPLPAVSAFGFMNDKMSTEIIGKEFEEHMDGLYKLNIAVNQAPVHVKNVIVNALLTLNNEDICYRGRVMLTEFDNAVYCGLSTCYHYYYDKYIDKGSIPPMCITPQEIWRLVNGVTNSRANPSEAQIKRIYESMNKMCSIRVKIDLKEEIDNHYILPDGKYITEIGTEANLINADYSYFKTSNGRMVEGYRIYQKPILYSYNQAKNHLLFAPFELLDTSASTGNNGNTVEFRSYLLHQIQLMNNNYRKSHKILYSTIYCKTGVPIPEERISRDAYDTDRAYENGLYKEARKDRDKIDSILSDWMEKKFIKGYSHIAGTRNRYRGIEIFLRPREEHLQAFNCPI